MFRLHKPFTNLAGGDNKRKTRKTQERQGVKKTQKTEGVSFLHSCVTVRQRKRRKKEQRKQKKKDIKKNAYLLHFSANKNLQKREKKVQESVERVTKTQRKERGKKQT